MTGLFNRIVYMWLLICVAVSFVSGGSEIAVCTLIAVPLIFYIIFITKGRIEFNKKVAICALIYYICLCLGMFLSNYSQEYGLVLVLPLLCLLILLEDGSMPSFSNAFKIDWFYIVLLVFTVYNIYLNVINGVEDIIFDSVGDKNYTGIMVYLLFIYSNKKGRILGIIVGVLYGLVFSGSRSYLILFALFYLIRIFADPISKFIEKRKITAGKMLILLFVITIIISYVWVYVISANGFDSYHESLNDVSNRIRFLANIKVFDLLAEPFEIWLWGYGSSAGVVSALGISNGATYFGQQLVQSHNCFLNLFLRIGLVPSIIYFVLLAQLLNKFWNKENIAYMIPYMVNAIFMHSLYNGKWLLFFIIILMIPQEKVFGRFKKNKEDIPCKENP